ncbi:MAG: hypothetical protein ACI8WT_004737 [Clostridium sp.]|jgi:hypothetical protein
MTLEELKFFLDKMYGFDLSIKTKKREKVYAKRVFINLAYNYGYEVQDIHPLMKLKHPVIKHHRSNFGTIMPIDLDMYNKCIDYFDLPMDKIPNVISISGDPRFSKIILKLKELNRADLKYFDEKWISVFIEKLAYEKSLGLGEKE